MARKKIPRKEAQTVYCCERRYDQLKVGFASSAKGAVMIAISLVKDGVDALSCLGEELPGRILVADPRMNRGVVEAVEAALSNRPVPKDLPLDLDATPFQMSVWRAIAEIPYGGTRTYGEVAEMAGSPLAARAVGQAMGRNPLPLLFP